MDKLIIITAATFSSFFFGLFGVDWDKIDRRIDREFPLVEFVAQEDLLAEMQSESLPLLVDVREPEEFSVSHLDGALNLQAATDIAARFPDRESAIVVYCSVGYRAAAVAEQLQQLGYTRVRNLRHAIFEWANNHRPMTNLAGATTSVHPFNRAWASLVDPALRRYSPD